MRKVFGVLALFVCSQAAYAGLCDPWVQSQVARDQAALNQAVADQLARDQESLNQAVAAQLQRDQESLNRSTDAQRAADWQAERELLIAAGMVGALAGFALAKLGSFFGRRKVL